VGTVSKPAQRTAALATLALLVVVALAILSAGCGSAASANGGSLTLGPADDGKSYTVKKGETIQIVIPGNPTTGYQWTSALSDKDRALLQEIGEPQYAPDSTDTNVAGSGGVYTLTFKAVEKGQATVKLAYARPWESGVAPIQTFTATVTIE
jgi:inhibitor of cysteine peptidase